MSRGLWIRDRGVPESVVAISASGTTLAHCRTDAVPHIPSGPRWLSGPVPGATFGNSGLGFGLSVVSYRVD